MITILYALGITVGSLLVVTIAVGIHFSVCENIFEISEENHKG